MTCYSRRWLPAVLMPLVFLLFSGGATAHYSLMHGGIDHEYTQDRFQGPITLDQARQILEDYLEKGGNPNLKPGDIQEKESYFLGEVVTRNGSLVNQIEIGKQAGRINTRHGLGTGDQDDRRDWNYCPYCGKGLHRSEGRHRMGGQGGMGHGYEYRSGPRWQDNDPMGADTAEKMVADYLSAIRNPNLKTGEISEKSQVFEVDIITKKNEDLVDVVQVDKYTGRMRSIY